MSGMGLMLRAGDHFEMKGRVVTVTQMQAVVGQRVREELIDVAKHGQTITYGELRAAANLSHPPTAWDDFST